MAQRFSDELGHGYVVVLGTSNDARFELGVEADGFDGGRLSPEAGGRACRGGR
jgi:hypothetical protein